jgi:tetrahydromethanopterin S-methyltransferase subunit F
MGIIIVAIAATILIHGYMVARICGLITGILSMAVTTIEDPSS